MIYDVNFQDMTRQLIIVNKEISDCEAVAAAEEEKMARYQVSYAPEFDACMSNNEIDGKNIDVIYIID